MNKPQWIEAIIDTLKGQLTFEEYCACTLSGVHTRIATRFLVMAAAIWRNWKT